MAKAAAFLFSLPSSLRDPLMAPLPVDGLDAMTSRTSARESQATAPSECLAGRGAKTVICLVHTTAKAH